MRTAARSIIFFLLFIPCLLRLLLGSSGKILSYQINFTVPLSSAFSAGEIMLDRKG